jgi:hypothetical protein
VHYVAFADPSGIDGRGSVLLHVADGSQIISRRANGPHLSIDVGLRRAEPYGSCLARLPLPALYGGYLPLLETRYVDSDGARYEQESFAARAPGTRSLVAFVRVRIDPRGSRAAAARVRFRSSPHTRVAFSAGGRAKGSSVTYSTTRDRPLTAYVAWLDSPSATGRGVDRKSYESARRSVVAYWTNRLAKGAMFMVPEKRVVDAERNLLIQNLELTWRYSVGNAYEEFEFPENIDGAPVIGEYGFQRVARAILTTALRRKLAYYPNWDMGDELRASAMYYELFRDRPYLARATPVLRQYVDRLGRQIDAGPRGLLHKELYASDLPDVVYGLNSQAVVWNGLRSISRAWSLSGNGHLAHRASTLAATLGSGLRAAVRASTKELSDGSLFVPVRLLDDETPYSALTASRSGSYWNLVMPYALGSGLFAPGSDEAKGVLRYMLGHGSRFLGLVRFGLDTLDRDRAYPTSGTDEVYGLDVARFLADNDQPDQLVLSLYGQLAAGMTPGTFVSGETATIAPVSGEEYRRMYLPPNSISNATFLETLRLMLVHETAAGLELAYSTPRAWLAPGRRITVRGTPTSFGRISYAIVAARNSVRARVKVPNRARPRMLRLRLRVPGTRPITAVQLDGRPFRRFDANAETIDLSGLSGTLHLVVRFG